MLPSKKIRDRVLILIGAALPLTGALWEISDGLKSGRISLFGNETFSLSNEAGLYWFTIVLYAAISIGLISAIVFVLSGKNDAAEKPNPESCVQRSAKKICAR